MALNISNFKNCNISESDGDSSPEEMADVGDARGGDQGGVLQGLG